MAYISGNARQELDMPVKVMAGNFMQEFSMSTKIVPASETTSEYTVGEEILALRSTGSWSPGTIAEITEEKLVVVLAEGTKQIRKEKAGQLLKKKKQPAYESPNNAYDECMRRCDRLLAQSRCLPYTQDPSYISQYACEQMLVSEADVRKNTSTRRQKQRDTSTPSWGSAVSTDSDGSRISSNSVAVSDASSTDDVGAEGVPDVRTTVMMCNIPNNLTRDQLLTIVNDEGFEKRYNLAYMPVDLKNRVGLGYAFINFVSHDDAIAFARHFNGFSNWNMSSGKCCEVKWTDLLQGLDEHVAKYRDFPVMHESIEDMFKPVLFEDGVRVPFPEPTKKIRAPRVWSRRQ